MAREYKDSANREHSYAGINYAEEQPVLERKLKDSGIEWIGEIPAEWNVTLLSTVFAEHCLKNIGLRETNLLSLSYGNIIRKNINENGGLLPESFDGYNIIDTNDIVFRLTDLQNDKRSLRTGLCKERGIITSAYTTIRSRGNNIYAPYFHYLFHSYDECKIFYGLGDGVRQSMNFQDLRKLQIVVPSLDEQQAIADFLDEKCGEIDKLVSLQEQMIEELKAYKQSVITETVTKGLNPDAPMKDSGIDWIGNVPAEWFETKIKFHGTIRSGDGISIEEIKEDGKYPVWGGNGLMGYTDKFNESDNSIIIGRVGALCGNVRVLERPTFVSDNALILRLLNDVHVGFMYWLLIGANLNRLNTSNAQPLITGTKVKNIKIALPSIDEQRSIASYLDSKCADIDSLIALKQQKIESLKEYKKSIIFEYVTGKKQIV